MQVRGRVRTARRAVGWGILLAVGLCVFPAGAEAQAWLSDRRATEGPGIMI